MNQEQWVENLFNHISDEEKLYVSILHLEDEKSDAIITANGQSLEIVSKKIYELIVTASEMERTRMKSIEEFYKLNNFSLDNLNLTDFLNKLDRESNFRLKSIGLKLRETIHKLKAKIGSNEKLLQTRAGILQNTIQHLKQSIHEDHLQTYSTKSNGPKKSQSILINATV